MSRRELSLIPKHSLTLSYSDFSQLIFRANTAFYRASGDVSEAQLPICLLHISVLYYSSPDGDQQYYDKGHTKCLYKLLVYRSIRILGEPSKATHIICLICRKFFCQRNKLTATFSISRISSKCFSASKVPIVSLSANNSPHVVHLATNSYSPLLS